MNIFTQAGLAALANFMRLNTVFHVDRYRVVFEQGVYPTETIGSQDLSQFAAGVLTRLIEEDALPALYDLDLGTENPKQRFACYTAEPGQRELGTTQCSFGETWPLAVVAAAIRWQIMKQERKS